MLDSRKESFKRVPLTTIKDIWGNEIDYCQSANAKHCVFIGNLDKFDGIFAIKTQGSANENLPFFLGKVLGEKVSFQTVRMATLHS